MHLVEWKTQLFNCIEQINHTTHTAIFTYSSNSSNSSLISLSGSLFNIRSLTVPNKYNFVFDHLMSVKPSFFGITETWLSIQNTPLAFLAAPDNYTFHHTPRENRGGGSLALICANYLKPTKLNTEKYTSFESIAIKLYSPKPSIVSVNYRPPSSSLSQFLEQFTDYLSLLLSLNFPFLVIGDFNIPVSYTHLTLPTICSV